MHGGVAIGGENKTHAIKLCDAIEIADAMEHWPFDQLSINDRDEPGEKLCNI